MVAVMTWLAASACAGWLVLWRFRGAFWRADQRLPADLPELTKWPSVSVIIPARNEAAFVAAAVRSLVAQQYAGEVDIVVVDDGSDDGTAAAARAAGAFVITGKPLPAGWTGKLWALQCGLRETRRRQPDGAFVLLTDADIVHAPTTLARLVGKAESEGLGLVSLMAHLHCEGGWERLLVPAFVFYFQKLYPFSWVNDPHRPEAAAAGGCVLVRRTMLDEMGGLAAIRNRLIDDCALAAAIKPHGRIWLGLTEDVRSLRPYRCLGDFWAMVARTAFTQLDHSWYRLTLAVAMMLVLYVVPPVAVCFGLITASVPLLLAGALAWLLMIGCVRPTLGLYRLSAWRGVLLPAAGALFTAMTLDSARRHRLGRGGMWKGRALARVGEG